VEPISWALADVESFAVEAADPKSGFKQTMNQQKPFVTPTAIKVTVRDSQGEMEWDLPVLIK
jgi:hypothetical protein